jgi:diguanylate cyclase (GGDEF)-like protein/PAS domain S-box-containing protein
MPKRLTHGAREGIPDTVADRALKALQVSERRFRLLFESALDGILLLNADTARIEDVNPNLIEMLGYPVAELVGKRLWDAGPFADLAKCNQMFFEMQGIGYARYEDLSLKTREGSTILVDLVSSAYDCDDIREIQCSVRDNTERKRADESLSLSEAHFRTLAEAVPQLVWLTGADGHPIYFNQQWMDYTGLTLEESLGPGCRNALHPDDRNEAWDSRQDAATMGAKSTECRLRRVDGVYRWWLMRRLPLRDAAGHILKWFCTCTDIHELKAAELDFSHTNRALRETERRFTDLLGNVQLVCVMLDLEDSISYCNDYTLHLTGWQRDDVIGRNWFERLVPPDNTDPQAASFAALLANQPKAWHRESEILTRAGDRRLIRWNNSLLRSTTGDIIGTASIGEDITERKEASDRIAHLNRVYAMLSGINSLIVRVPDREALFREACQIAVKEGGFQMSLIGIVDPGAQLIVPVASSGKNNEILTAIRRLVSSRQLQSTTMVGRAVAGKKAVISNDSRNDPQVLLRDEYAEAGVRSMAILPLLIADEAVGALALYASEAEFFHEEEMVLLTALSGDIAFAIDHINKRERLNYLAFYDELTGLANRSLFIERVAQYMRSIGGGRRNIAVGALDLERFRNVNHSLGRAAGDSLLKQTAEWLTETLGDANLLARIDADHFGFVLPDIKHERDVPRLVEEVLEEFVKHPFKLNDEIFRVAAKVGIAIYPEDGAGAELLFRNAEVALLKAKASGDRYLLFAQKMTDTMANKPTLESQLRDAVENDEFILHYQPKVNLLSGELTGAEALIRWNMPGIGLVPPMRFIPILEETGLIFEVGRWALQKAISDYLHWRAAGLPVVRIAVNVSPLQLANRGFIGEIRRTLGIDPHAASGLELEITEGTIMEDLEHNIGNLTEIRALGVTIAIDDFGTGFSSLRYLAKLPVDTLKIDRSFIVDMTASAAGLALVSTIINLGHSLNLKLVAEGVETEEQSQLLRSLRCDEMQGYLVGRPVPGDTFEASHLLPPPEAYELR